ncbi:MAG: 30S ribosomal protein S15 [Bacteroidetes bacterium]|jgi:small subunit ribosomal protein S15|nr:30S ribosomal protein S15 [Bacteroidota bacterium]
MYLTKEKTAEIFKANSLKGDAKDAGSAESQIALFTYRINHLNEHLKQNRKDMSTKMGLLRLVGQRRKMLDYLRDKDIQRYRDIIQKLGIRK